MKLYDMIQVYSSGSTVIMHMHYIWPVLHMTSCLVAINKNRDMCFDMKNGKKNIFQWGNPGERLSECVEGVEIYKINLKKIFTYLKSFMQRIIQKPILKLFTLCQCSNQSCHILSFSWLYRAHPADDCTYSQKYHVSCGLFGWGRCTRYR